MNTLIQHATIIKRGNERVAADIWIADGKIQAIGHFATKNIGFSKIIDVQGALVTAGFVDVHVHFREPGFTYKETIETGSNAAARGGYTSVCAMPNTNPVPDTVEHLAQMQQIIDRDATVRVYPYASITQELKTETLVDMEALAAAGAFAFTNDGVGVQTAGTMYLAMKEAARLGKAIVAHTEDESLLFGGVMHAGKVAKKLGLPGIMSATESSQIARDLLLAEETGVHYHVCHVSTKESVRVIRDAKRAGIHVTCEVCPHHLILNEEAITHDHGNFKMNPPLRAQEDQAALLEGLLDGTIDFIATDHAPHSHEEKNQSMLKAPFGIVGSETAFGLLYTHFVQPGVFTLEQLVHWMSRKPAETFGLPGGFLTVGEPADLTVIQLDQPQTIDAHDFLSKSANTPFLGEIVQAEPLVTIVKGEIVWQKGANA